MEMDVWFRAYTCSFIFCGGLITSRNPRWLVKTGQDRKAREVLSRIGDLGFAQQSLFDIEQSLTGVTKTNYSDILKKGVLPAVLVGIGLAVFQQFCGINTVFNYAPKIFESIGASQDDQLLQTVFIGVVNLVFTILAMALVDKLGRKPLMLIGAGSLGILYIVVAQLLGTQSPHVSWFLLTAIGMYSLSLAPVTWVLISEIFPNRVRGEATSIAVISLWIAYFILVFTFPVIFEKMQDKSFYIYSVVCFAGLIFVWWKVKETKGKTLEELENIMSR